MVKRKIPATMATQHPDNAQAAYWCDKKFISTSDEIEECFLSFSELKCDEYMWDWEGKFVDESVIDKLFRQHHDFFKKHPLGKDFFLTFRIPNIWKEKGFRLARAFMNILTAEDLAEEVKLHSPPIFEVILPMTKTAEQLMHVQETFAKIAELKDQIFKSSKGAMKQIDLIPLFEEVDDLNHVERVLEPYLAAYKKAFGKKPTYMRPFIARSDPALNAGLVPAVLSSKVAISTIYKIGKKHKIEMYP
ncbi:MAG: phosphoenolpyruvate carboxylase, partial [Patescibacteria group bacterium]